MANIFRKKDQYIDRVNRSTFDLSFVNNLTMKFGAITPVCLLPASFGDSFQINARFNLQLLPTVFPIQTQLYVRLHFVYVRTRTLWEDWMAFFGYKKCVNDRMVQLLIPADAKRTSATLPSCRCNKAKVLTIKSFDFKENYEEAWSLVDENFVYRRGQWVKVKDFNEDRWQDSTTGIHFWMTRQEAENY